MKAGPIIFFCLILPLALGAAVSPPDQVNRTPVVEFPALTAMIDSGRPMLLLDARAEDPFREGHIATAVNLPGYVFEKDVIPGLPENRALPIVAYCSGGHCGIAWYVAERLLDLGYDKVMVFEEGVEGWLKRGQLLVNGKHEQLPTIKKSDLTALLASGASVSLIDARSLPEYTVQTIPQAVSLPLDKCQPGTDGMPPGLDKLTVVFGQGRWDGRPYHVADRLRGWGYRQVRIYPDGLNGWRQK